MTYIKGHNKRSDACFKFASSRIRLTSGGEHLVPQSFASFEPIPRLLAAEPPWFKYLNCPPISEISQLDTLLNYQKSIKHRSSWPRQIATWRMLQCFIMQFSLYINLDQRAQCVCEQRRRGKGAQVASPNFPFEKGHQLTLRHN